MSCPVDVQIGSLSLRIGRQSVAAAKTQIYFTKAEFSIFSAIALSGPDDVGLERLCGVIGRTATTRAIAIVRTHVSAIRRKISNLDDGSVSIDSGPEGLSFRLRSRI
jgi:DNA-binding response OmpR family regulator